MDGWMDLSEVGARIKCCHARSACRRSERGAGAGSGCVHGPILRVSSQYTSANGFSPGLETNRRQPARSRLTFSNMDRASLRSLHR